MKPAFSTVACPELTLEAVARLAERAGALGVELRTMGHESAPFACDPMWTDPAKIRRLFAGTGCSICSIGTSIRFDEPVRPPLIGRIFGDGQRAVREVKRAVQLAAELEAPMVRVFGFEYPIGEKRSRAVDRIAERLDGALATARNTGVQIAIENGGSFPTAVAIAELLDRADNPLLGAAYSIAVARSAGEQPRDGANVLGERMLSVKLRDFHHGRPCTLGDGGCRVHESLSMLGDIGFRGWLIHEYDRAWLQRADQGPLPDAEGVVRTSIRAIYDAIASRDQRRTPDRALAPV